MPPLVHMTSHSVMLRRGGSVHPTMQVAAAKNPTPDSARETKARPFFMRGALASRHTTRRSVRPSLYGRAQNHARTERAHWRASPGARATPALREVALRSSVGISRTLKDRCLADGTEHALLSLHR